MADDFYKVVLYQTLDNLMELERWDLEENNGKSWSKKLIEYNRKEELMSLLKQYNIPIKARILLEPMIHKVTLFVTKAQFDVLLNMFSYKQLNLHLHNYGVCNEEYYSIMYAIQEFDLEQSTAEPIPVDDYVIERDIFMQSISLCLGEESIREL